MTIFGPFWRLYGFCGLTGFSILSYIKKEDQWLFSLRSLLTILLRILMSKSTFEIWVNYTAISDNCYFLQVFRLTIYGTISYVVILRDWNIVYIYSIIEINCYLLAPDNAFITNSFY